jgi:hypothetical protein
MSFPKNSPDRRSQEILFEEMGDGILTMFNNRGLTFFEPSMDFIRWIGEYANGRLILEIGSGVGHVLHLLRHAGFNKVMGIEPAWDVVEGMKANLDDKHGVLHILPRTVEESANMIRTLTKDNKALILVCRPCHGDFVEEAANIMESGSELMYITKPENLQKYADLGVYQHLLTKVPHAGSSVDEEEVYVMTKP